MIQINCVELQNIYLTYMNNFYLVIFLQQSLKIEPHTITQEANAPVILLYTLQM